MFEVGMRVKCHHRHDGNSHIEGEEGTIIFICDSFLTVEFDRGIMGHDGGRRGKDYHCWEFSKMVWSTHLQLLSVLMGPPLPIHVIIERKCKKLWNSSTFISSHSKLAY